MIFNTLKYTIVLKLSKYDNLMKFQDVPILIMKSRIIYQSFTRHFRHSSPSLSH